MAASIGAFAIRSSPPRMAPRYARAFARVRLVAAHFMTPAHDHPAFAPLHQEWHVLQTQHERHETCAHGIKLAAVALCAVGWLYALDVVLASVLTLLLWGQESILRTTQARLGARILRAEAALRALDATAVPCQLHSEWLAARPGIAGLLAEYVGNAWRPAVAYPYVLMLAAQWLLAAA